MNFKMCYVYQEEKKQRCTDSPCNDSQRVNPGQSVFNFFSQRVC